MKRYALTFIGELPPPYGGVTVKNLLVFQKVFQGFDAQFIDLAECKRRPWKIFEIFYKIVSSMVISRTVVIGVGSTWRRKILLRMQWMLTGQNGLKKVMLLVMGGQFHLQVAKDRSLCKLIQQIDSLWVETEKMLYALKKMGIEQTYYFPNGRDDRGSRPPRVREADSVLKLVFFSRICEEKGVGIIMKAYETWKMEKVPITLDFYGEISDNIKGQFDDFIQKSECIYHGVFDTANRDVYKELNQYDILLLPTLCKGEGVPGALIESKMAGITAIVSELLVNNDVVRNSLEGVVLSQLTAEALASTVLALCKSPERVQLLKEGAYESRYRYCIETYRQSLIDHALG